MGLGDPPRLPRKTVGRVAQRICKWKGDSGSAWGMERTVPRDVGTVHDPIATDVEYMSICETMAGPSAESCVRTCEMVEPDEFLSLATSRMPLERTQSPGDGLVGLMDVASGRNVAVESQRLEKFRLRRK